MNNGKMIVNVRLDSIENNPFQTRLVLDHEHIGNLASDIRANGLLEIPAARPVDVNGWLVPYTEGCEMQLAYGHNRYQAFYLLNGMYEGEYATMPVMVVQYTDEQMAITAWSENENRKSLNPIERAAAIQKMLDNFSWTQQQVAEKLRMDRSTVSNTLRLLKLPDQVMQSLVEGAVTQRQATALMPFYDLTDDEQDGLLLQADFAEFMDLARSGQIDSDTIRAKVGAAIDVIHPKPAQFDFDDSTPRNSPGAGNAPTDVQNEVQKTVEGWMQKDIEGNDVAPVVEVLTGKPASDLPEVKPVAPVLPENQPELPAATGTVITTMPLIVVPDATLPVSASQPVVEQGNESPLPPLPAAPQVGQNTLKPWPESTYTVNMGFMADDGSDLGRNVIVSVGREGGKPAFVTMRQKAFNIPWQIEKMIQDLHPEDQVPAVEG